MKKVINGLSELIRHGDHEAENDFFSHYGEKIDAIISTRLGVNNPDWEDVCSEIKTAILIKLREGMYDPEKGNLSSYIHGIALNKLKDYYKSQKKKKDHLQILNPEEIQEPANEKTDMEKEELRIILQNVLGSLKDKYKKVIYLRYYQELTIPEIADQLQIESRRVSERINYANKLIRKQCKKKNLLSIFWHNLLIYI